MKPEDMLDIAREFAMARMQVELRHISDPNLLREMCMRLIDMNLAQREVLERMFKNQ